MSGDRRGAVLAALRSARASLDTATIAERLDMHPNTVRFQLAALVDSGQVEQVASATSGPGRPALRFRAHTGMDPAGARNYRVLAEMMTTAFAAEPDASGKSRDAGRAWGAAAVGSVSGDDCGVDNEVDQLVTVLDDLGFAPERRIEPGGETIGLRSCPFLELIEQRGDMICPAHLGLMQGALAALGSQLTVQALEPFVAPDLCLAHLGPALAPG